MSHLDALEANGLTVVTMTPALAPALNDFHEQLSATTISRRFFSVHPHLSPDELARFTTVDHHDREALVALDDEGRIVAVARFDRLDPGSTTAEVAFVVDDEWQHRGIGGAMFARLAARAAELGVRRFVADTLASNRAMLAVFQHAGFPTRAQFDEGVVQITIELAPD
jgi:RimJ/RimL family protein N-acetyltransferase